MQKLIYGIFAALVLLLLGGFLMPRTHQVEVEIEVDAHAATVFALINDFHRQAEWLPWTETDPNARILFSGAARGEGAVMTWDGAIIGSGSQVIAESRANDFVGITMNPGSDGEARSWFRLAPGTGTTIVVWGFETDYGLNVVGRYFAPMLGGVVARDFYSGLERLKEFAEALPSADFSDIDAEHIVVSATDVAILPTSSRPEPDAIATALRDAYFEILTFIDAQGLQDSGAPISITRDFSGVRLAFDAAIPVRGLTDETPRDGPGVRVASTYAGPVVRVRHVGSYRTLAETHRKVSAYLAATGLKRNGAAWESYVSDPANVDESELVTYLYYPIRQ